MREAGAWIIECETGTELLDRMRGAAGRGGNGAFPTGGDR